MMHPVSKKWAYGVRQTVLKLSLALEGVGGVRLGDHRLAKQGMEIITVHCFRSSSGFLTSIFFCFKPGNKNTFAPAIPAIADYNKQ